MFDTTPERSHQRAQLLSLSLGAQRGMTHDHPADYWYLKGTRNAGIDAVAGLATGCLGDSARAAAGRVDDLITNGAQDVADLMAALDPRPQAEARNGLTWTGPVSFEQVTSTCPGIDHDLGARWGAQQDIRLSHRRPRDGTDGLLYAYDRTWDEYTVLADTIDANTVETAVAAALALDPHLPGDRFAHVVHDIRAGRSAHGAAPDLGPVLR